MSKSTKSASKSATPTRREGLRKPQVRILQALSKAKGPMNRRQLAEKSAVAESWVIGFTFKACAANTSPALAELGLVKGREIDVEGRKELCFEITPKGRQAMAKALESAKEKAKAA